ncbi:kinase [Thraustotheca clavata]|uniref:Kinase n=1 Tax=Thraustotheca clavata TaxID=74557 RepID=A0A1V9Z0T1_9STRA|nr:kinase [Thraustotheca clavata]
MKVYDALLPFKDSYYIDPQEIMWIRFKLYAYRFRNLQRCYRSSNHLITQKLPKNPKTAYCRNIVQDKTKPINPTLSTLSDLISTVKKDYIALLNLSKEKLCGIFNNQRQTNRLTWKHQMIEIAIGIASALVYMHSLKPVLIHRNLKASTVLLTAKQLPKVSGFGISPDRTIESAMTNGVGDIRWSAPELLLDDEIYSEKIDVYSFGVVLTELDTYQLPYQQELMTMSKSGLTMKLITGTLRPEVSAQCPRKILSIIKPCLQHDPKLRLDSTKVWSLLKEAKKSIHQTISN